MPERFAGGRIEGEQIAGGIAGEEQASGGGENSGGDFAVTEFAVPNEFAGAVIESANSGVGPKVAVATAPAFGFGGDGVVVDAEEATGVDIEEVRLRIETGSHPVGGAVGAGRNESTIGSGSGFGLGDGTAALINAARPGFFDERRSDEMLAGGAIENKEETVAAGLREEFTRFAFEVGVK